MYTATAQEVAAANERCAAMHVVAGRWVPKQENTTETMPLMSFPWLFQRELGMIANKKDDAMSMTAYAPTTHRTGKTSTYTVGEALGDLPPTKPSISTSDIESNNLIEFSAGSQSITSEPASAKQADRKDSLELLSNKPHSQNSVFLSTPSPAPDQDSGSQLSASPAQEFAKSVLSDSSALAGSDGDVLGRGLAEIERLPDESEGDCENQASEEDGLGKALCETENMPAEASEKDDGDDGEGEPVTFEIEESAGMKALNKLYAMYG